MTGAARYARLVYAFGRFGLLSEMAFRGNFLIKIFVELLWLSFLLIFYRTVFSQTSMVAGSWRRRCGNRAMGHGLTGRGSRTSARTWPDRTRGGTSWGC